MKYFFITNKNNFFIFINYFKYLIKNLIELLLFIILIHLELRNYR